MILDTADVISTNTSSAKIYIEEALYLFTYITVQHYFYFRWCLCRQIVIRPIFSGVYVAQSLGFRVVFSRYLHNIYHLFLDHCIVCPSSIYVFRFPLWYLESVLISVILLCYTFIFILLFLIMSDYFVWLCIQYVWQHKPFLLIRSIVINMLIWNVNDILVLCRINTQLCLKPYWKLSLCLILPLTKTISVIIWRISNWILHWKIKLFTN